MMFLYLIVNNSYAVHGLLPCQPHSESPMGSERPGQSGAGNHQCCQEQVEELDLYNLGIASEPLEHPVAFNLGAEARRDSIKLRNPR